MVPFCKEMDFNEHAAELQRLTFSILKLNVDCLSWFHYLVVLLIGVEFLDFEIGDRRDVLHSNTAARRSSLFDYALLDGEPEEFGIVGEAEVLHDAVFVEGDGAGGDVEDGGGFFHGVALGQQL